MTDDTVSDIWDRIRTNDETYPVAAPGGGVEEIRAVPNYVIAREFDIGEEDAIMAANRLAAAGKVRTALRTLPDAGYNDRGEPERFYRPESGLH